MPNYEQAHIEKAPTVNEWGLRTGGAKEVVDPVVGSLFQADPQSIGKSIVDADEELHPLVLTEGVAPSIQAWWTNSGLGTES